MHTHSQSTPLALRRVLGKATHAEREKANLPPTRNAGPKKSHSGSAGVRNFLVFASLFRITKAKKTINGTNRPKYSNNYLQNEDTTCWGQKRMKSCRRSVAFLAISVLVLFF